MTQATTLLDLNRTLTLETALQVASDPALAFYKIEQGHGEEVDWNLILKNWVCLLVGRANSGKSWLTLLRQRLVAAGATCFLLPLRKIFEQSQLSTLLTRQEVELLAYFSPSWTAFQADRGRDFSVIVDGVSD
jgi:hypothetical protein